MKEQHINYDSVKLSLKCEMPNIKIYHFNGQLTMDSPNIGTVGVNIQQFIPRGSSLSNTDWIIGLVVYSGKDTKLMKNMGKNKYKQSHIERSLNIVVLVLVIIQFVFCIILAFLSAIWEQENNIRTENGELKGPWYLHEITDETDPNFGLDFMYGVFKYYLLLNSILPIGLLISFEVIKTLQSIWLMWDSQ